MSAPDQQIPPGWLTQFRRGALSGVGLLLIAVGCCAIPAFAAWFLPGADTTPASSALKAAGLLALAAAHGGLVLDGTRVTLTPLLVTGLLGWLVAGHARRLDSWSGFAGLVTGYTAASAALAGWSRLGATYAPVPRSAIAAVVFVLVAGGGARSAGHLWSRLTDRWRRVCRAAAMVTAGYLVAGSLLAAGALIGHFSDAAALQRQLAPGVTGLPVALLGVSATPNAVLAAVGYLTGPGFAVGTHTSVSIFAVRSGRLPVFPLLAGVPHGRPLTGIGLAAVLLLALLAGWVAARTVSVRTVSAHTVSAHTVSSRAVSRRLLDCAAVAGLAAAQLAVLTRLGAGDLGPGALRGVGSTWWSVGLATALVVLVGAAVWLGVEVLRARPASGIGARLYALRSEPADHPPAEPPVAEAAPAEQRTRSRNAS